MTECLHHWLLESPDGPTIPGVCKLCGATRVWTYPDYYDTNISVVHLKDPLPRRTNIGQSSNWQGSF